MLDIVIDEASEVTAEQWDALSDLVKRTKPVFAIKTPLRESIWPGLESA